MSTTEVTQKPDIRYFWLRDEHKRPVACIATERKKKKLKFALAIYNPLDIFEKDMGRKVALARLTGKHSRFSGAIALDGKSQSVKVKSPDGQKVVSVGNVKTKLLYSLITTGVTNKKKPPFDVIPQRVIAAARYQFSVYKDKNLGVSDAKKKTALSTEDSEGSERVG